MCSITLLAASASHAQVPSVGMRQIQSGNMPITLSYHTAAAAQAFTQGAFTVQVASNAAPLAAASGQRTLIVLSHGTAGSALPDHALAATQVRGGLLNPNFSPEERQKAFELIALFFKQKL